VKGLEANYVSTSETTLDDLANRVGKADLIIDATGSSEIAFNAMQYLGHNGVLVWTSITGGKKNAFRPFRQDQYRMGAGEQAATRLRQRESRIL